MYQGKAYKYRSFSGLEHPNSLAESRIEELLVERKCWFAKPSSLNDPFDCLPYVKLSNSGASRLLQKQKINSSNIPEHVTTAEFKTRIQSQFNSQIFIDAMDECVGVYCLGQHPTASTLWTYYGGEHTGFCIEYDAGLAFPLVKAVQYNDKRPKLDVRKTSSTYARKDQYLRRRIEKILFTKGLNWRHEQEIRALCPSSGLFEVPPGSITGIYFGAKTSEEHINFICTLLDKNSLVTPCYQIQLCGRSFQLIVKPLNTS